MEVWYNMQIVNAANLDYKALNEALRKAGGDCIIEGCCGQRFIGFGMSGKNIDPRDTRKRSGCIPLNNSCITVKGNAQDAVGDTMNEGKILICEQHWRGRCRLRHAREAGLRTGQRRLPRRNPYESLSAEGSRYDHRRLRRKTLWANIRQAVSLSFSDFLKTADTSSATSPAPHAGGKYSCAEAVKYAFFRAGNGKARCPGGPG